jgi:DNA-binding NarL/FixJ family response regulator
MMKYIKNATILAVDDDPFNLLVIEGCLAGCCQKLLLESNIDAALALAAKEQPDVILLDIVMNDMDGYELCHRLKADDKTKNIPIIFLSALMDAADKVKGFRVGAVDYISKPFAPEEVVVRIENCLKLHQQIHQKQQKIANEATEKIKQYQLTKRQIEIFQLYTLGFQRTEIAEKLFVSEDTVKFHLRNIFLKLKITSRAQAIEKARELGLSDY